MSVAKIQDWRLQGCGDNCTPRLHDLTDHERSGYAQAIEDMRPRTVVVGCLSIDLVTQVVTVDGAGVPLTSTEWKIVAYLAHRHGLWCSIQEIVAAVWGEDWGDDDGHVVRTNMARLRAKLGDARGLIVTRPGFGYLLRSNEHDPIALPVVPITPRPWSKFWPCCQWCKTTKRPHNGRGLCGVCYHRQKRSGKPL